LGQINRSPVGRGLSKSLGLAISDRQAIFLAGTNAVDRLSTGFFQNDVAQKGLERKIQ